jgi:hypothetical protein
MPPGAGEFLRLHLQGCSLPKTVRRGDRLLVAPPWTVYIITEINWLLFWRGAGAGKRAPSLLMALLPNEQGQIGAS